MKFSQLTSALFALSAHLRSFATLTISSFQVEIVGQVLPVIFAFMNKNSLFKKNLFYLVLYFAATQILGVFLFNYKLNNELIIKLLSFWAIVAGALEILRKQRDILINIFCFASLVASIFGVIEFLLGAANAYGVDGFSGEPSHFAVTIAPALYLYLKQKKIKHALMIQIAMIATFSVTGIMLTFVVNLIVFRFVRRMFFVITIFITLISSISFSLNLPGFNEAKMKITETVSFDFQELGSAEIVNAFGPNRSTSSLFSNYYVAKCNLVDFFPLGCGFSLHQQSYERTFSQWAFKNSLFYGTNWKSGHNLLIRWISEFGILGIIVLLISLNRLLRLSDYERQVAIFALIHFIGKSMKLGSFVDYGTPFFMAIIILQLKRS